jgi:hypothetical protein
MTTHEQPRQSVATKTVIRIIRGKRQTANSDRRGRHDNDRKKTYQLRTGRLLERLPSALEPSSSTPAPRKKRGRVTTRLSISQQDNRRPARLPRDLVLQPGLSLPHLAFHRPQRPIRSRMSMPPYILCPVSVSGRRGHPRATRMVPVARAARLRLPRCGFCILHSSLRPCVAVVTLRGRKGERHQERRDEQGQGEMERRVATMPKLQRSPDLWEVT